jgi:hypothetical protein
MVVARRTEHTAILFGKAAHFRSVLEVPRAEALKHEVGVRLAWFTKGQLDLPVERPHRLAVVRALPAEAMPQREPGFGLSRCGTLVVEDGDVRRKTGDAECLYCHGALDELRLQREELVHGFPQKPLAVLQHDLELDVRLGVEVPRETQKVCPERGRPDQYLHGVAISESSERVMPLLAQRRDTSRASFLRNDAK